MREPSKTELDSAFHVASRCFRGTDSSENRKASAASRPLERAMARFPLLPGCRRSSHVRAAAVLALLASPAYAGPPYVTDDPAPTEYGHTETYLFTGGATAHDGWGGAAGIDFNYGAAPDLQLTAMLPLAWDHPNAGPGANGLGNIELAAKYRFLHQEDAGIDVAFFPRAFLPAGSAATGDRNTSLLLPLWIGRSGKTWSSFGGGGCVIHRGGAARDYCQLGWALTAQVTPAVQVGAEFYHQTADTRGGDASTGLGLGITIDVTEHLHVMASAGPGLQHRATTDQAAWYAALLLTY